MIDAEGFRTVIAVAYMGLCLAVFVDGGLRWRDRALILIFCGACSALLIFFALPAKP